MNRIIITGNISTDIEFKTTSGGAPVSKFNQAVKRMKDGVDFIPIVAWNQVAENVNNYCEKGSKILVEGRLQTSSYEKDGVKRLSTDVVADKIEFLTRKENKESNPFENMSTRTDFDASKQIKITEDDLPF